MENKKYKIILLPLFHNDLRQIIYYIVYKLKNAIAANNLNNKILEEIEKRSYYPEYYEKYRSLKHRNYTYYRIYIKNYIIFYTVSDNIMEVRRILYSKRNFKNLI